MDVRWRIKIPQEPAFLQRAPVQQGIYARLIRALHAQNAIGPQEARSRAHKFHKLVNMLDDVAQQDEIEALAELGVGEIHLPDIQPSSLSPADLREINIASDSFPSQLSGSGEDRKSTRLNSSHMSISYAV